MLVYVDHGTFKWGWDDDAGEPAANVRADVWAMRSLDDGKTWTSRQRIFEGYCGALINIIETRSGDIVVPVPMLMYGPGRTRHAHMSRATRERHGSVATSSTVAATATTAGPTRVRSSS